MPGLCGCCYVVALWALVSQTMPAPHRAVPARAPLCQVADFGLSRVVYQAAVRTSSYGTVGAMPLELLEQALLTKAADVYSFGVLCWEVRVGGAGGSAAVWAWQRLQAAAQSFTAAPNCRPVAVLQMFSCRRAWAGRTPVQILYARTTLGQRLEAPEDAPPGFKVRALPAT